MLPLDVLTTYGLLTASIVALWFRPRFIPHPELSDVWLFPFLASLAVGLWAGFVTPVALLFISVLFLSAYLAATDRAAAYKRRTAIVAIIVLSAGFMTHVVPGFANYKVISDVTFSAGALPYNCLASEINWTRPT